MAGQYIFAVQGDNICVAYHQNSQTIRITGTNKYNVSFATIQYDGKFCDLRLGRRAAIRKRVQGQVQPVSVGHAGSYQFDQLSDWYLEFKY